MVLPSRLIRIFETLVVDGVVEALDQLETNDTIVSCAVLDDRFAANISWKSVEGIHTLGVENLIDTNMKILLGMELQASGRNWGVVGGITKDYRRLALEQTP